MNPCDVLLTFDRDDDLVFIDKHTFEHVHRLEAAWSEIRDECRPSPPHPPGAGLGATGNYISAASRRTRRVQAAADLWWLREAVRVAGRHDRSGAVLLLV